jgi:YegS/Rv2252/BmrU family lipid kinase
MYKKFLIIHNKMAGRLKAPMLTDVVAQLEERGAELVLKGAASVEEDIELSSRAALEKKVDAVIAAGGDSTIRGVAMGLMGTDMPLGIIPAGTGNVLAQEIDLGHDPGKIAGTIIEGSRRSIVPGLANGEPFLLMAGAGFDAEIVKNLDHDLKQRIRKAAYTWPTLKALAAKPQPLNIEFCDDIADEKNGYSYRAAFVVITKVRHYGGSFTIAPDADLAANELQVVMFMNRGRLGMLRALLGLAMGQNKHVKKTVMQDGRLVGHIMKTAGVMIRSCKKVKISSENPVPTQIDGEWLGMTPLQISINDQAVNLIVPPDCSWGDNLK